jgi:integrase
MPSKIARVLGPYRNGDKWRLVVFDDKGNRMARLAETEKEAEQIKASMLRLFDDRSLLTVDAALTEWFEAKREAGIKPQSIRAQANRLRPFLPHEVTLGEITPQRAAQLYQDETRRVGRLGLLRACTHHKTLTFAKGFFSWTVERGYLRESPFAKVKPTGKANAGKPQLREDEARKLYDLAVSLAETGDAAALAVLIQMSHGLRSAEVLALRARDLDAGGTVLVVEGTKTKHAKRRIEIASTVVRDLLGRRCVALRPDALIFTTAKGRTHHTDYLYRALRRLCARADVPIVCPHSLRGLYSSLAVSQGESSHAVARALGHGSDGVTRKHYIKPEALDTGRARRVAEALETPASPNLEKLAGVLAALTPEQLEKLWSFVAEKRKSV